VGSDAGERQGDGGFDGCARYSRVALARNFQFLPALVMAACSSSPDGQSAGAEKFGCADVRLRLRFSVWQNHLPVDALPVEGWIELALLAEEDLAAMGG